MSTTPRTQETDPSVFDVSPRLESNPGTEDDDRQATDEPTEPKELGLDFRIPERSRLILPQGILEHLAKAKSENMLTDVNTLGPDAFYSWDTWIHRSWCVPGSPAWLVTFPAPWMY